MKAILPLRGRRLLQALSLLTVCSLALSRPAEAQLLGPSPYLNFDNSLPGAGTAISPFAGLSFANYFHLETFEDAALNTPGVSSAGIVIVPGGITDSVDGDDGTIDGFGTLGHTFFGDGATGLLFTFDGVALGGLPTHAGIVWTDGFGDITFQAFDAGGILIGTLGGTHANGSISGETDDDRFYGIIAPGGIGSIFSAATRVSTLSVTSQASVEGVGITALVAGTVQRTVSVVGRLWT